MTLTRVRPVIRKIPVILAIVLAITGLASASWAVTRTSSRPAARMAAGTSATTIYGCLTSKHTLAGVSTGTPIACPSGQVPVSWDGSQVTPVPTPTGSATPTPTGSATPTPTGSATPAPTGSASWSCVVTGASGTCPESSDYLDPADLTMSNGYNTYAANNCWADPSCNQTLRANSPQDWQVTATEPAGNGSVRTGPELQQQSNNWCAAESNWQNKLADGCGGNPLSDVPLSALSSWTSSYSETLPHNSQTITEAAYDIWTNYSSDIMIWNDTVNRCNPGAFGSTVLGTGISIGGSIYDAYRYGGPGAEIIFVLEGPGGAGTCAQVASGSADILGVLNWVSTHVTPITSVSLIDYGFEICSTGGSPEDFSVSSYSMAANPA